MFEFSQEVGGCFSHRCALLSPSFDAHLFTRTLACVRDLSDTTFLCLYAAYCRISVAMDPEVTLELVQILNLYREWSARKGRKHGVHPINAARKEKGQFHTLVGELRQDADRFRRYTRMSLAAFDKLLGPVGREVGPCFLLVRFLQMYLLSASKCTFLGK